MHLALLMTNTDESDFAQDHPRDGEKFTTLVHLVRPDWRVEVFNVKDGVFPDDITDFDGVMITGSPSSVRSGAAWIDRLLQLVRDAHAAQVPMFGACFGHQAIALALGGTIGPNPGGWVHGLTRNTMVHRPDWARGLPDVVRLYGSHTEQVTTLPEGAKPLSTSEGCPVSSFAIGNSIYTTQHHPEMTRHFITALTEEMADTLGPGLTARAYASFSEFSDMEPFAASIARFFEQAVQEQAR